MRKRKDSASSIGCIHLLSDLSDAHSLAPMLSSSVSSMPTDLTSGDFFETSAALATLAPSRTGRYPPAANCIVSVLARMAEVVATNVVDFTSIFIAAIVRVVCPLITTVCTIVRSSQRKKDSILVSVIKSGRNNSTHDLRSICIYQ